MSENKKEDKFNLFTNCSSLQSAEPDLEYIYRKNLSDIQKDWLMSKKLQEAIEKISLLHKKLDKSDEELNLLQKKVNISLILSCIPYCLLIYLIFFS